MADLEPDGPIFESDGAGANKPHTLRSQCGPGPEPDPLLSYPARTWMSGAGRADKSESNGAELICITADLGCSRTHK